MSYHTVYPSWVVWQLFLYLFICVPTTAFTWLSTFCTWHLSSTFYLSQDTSWVQGFIFEEELQFSKLFKMTICKGMCTLKCTEKRVILFTPPTFCSINLSPIQNLKEALICLLECTVTHIFKKLCAVQPSSPLYPIHPLSLFISLNRSTLWLVSYRYTFLLLMLAQTEGSFLFADWSAVPGGESRDWRIIVLCRLISCSWRRVTWLEDRTLTTSLS
jgi:hypothetical protein